MKKFYKYSFVLILFTVIIIVGCKKTADNTPAVKGIPLKITELLQKSQTNLVLHSQNLNIIDFVYYQKINSESEKDSLVEKLTNRKSSWYASGNILADSTVIVSSLGSFTTDSLAKENLKKYIAKSIFIGNEVVKINWKFKDSLFSSLAIINDTSLLWDGLLTNLLMVEHNAHIYKSISNEKHAPAYDIPYSESWAAYWLWGSQRGEMGYNMIIHCSGNTVTSTDITSYAWIDIGTAQAESQVIHNSGTYGQAQYALGMASPLCTITFDYGPFTITITGIGSNMVENGTHSLYP